MEELSMRHIYYAGPELPLAPEDPVGEGIIVNGKDDEKKEEAPKA